MFKGPDLPLIEEVETIIPQEGLFDIFRDQPYCFWLDSALDPQKLGRYSLMGSQPFLLLKSRGSANTIILDERHTVETGNPFDILNRYLDMYRLDF